MRLKKSDNVLIISGKDKNKTAKILKTFPNKGRILVEGINIKKVHKRKKKEGDKGQVVEIAFPLPVSKVKFICPSCKQPTRLGYNILEKEKQRICKKCKAQV